MASTARFEGLVDISPDFQEQRQHVESVLIIPTSLRKLTHEDGDSTVCCPFFDVSTSTHGLQANFGTVSGGRLKIVDELVSFWVTPT